MSELRSTVRRLRSPDPVPQLPAGLSDLPRLADQARGNGLDVWIDETGDARQVPDPLGQAAYRIVQEALTNIIRHADAARAVVTLDQGPDALTITVRDDGKGASEIVRGNGIRGMRERAAEWGGDVAVTSRGPWRRDRRDRGAALAAVCRWEVRHVIRVVPADDQALVRSGLRALLANSDDILIVGDAIDGREAVAVVARTQPDVVLMDLRMPGLDGIAATQRITADPRLSDVAIIMLTTFDEDDEIFAAIRAGASGYLLKDAEPEDLREAIRVVAAGDALLSASVTRKVMEGIVSGPAGVADRSRLNELTERERDVLAGVGRGLSNDEIAAEISISPATARTYVSRMLTKLEARDRAQLVVIAYETGLVKPGRSGERPHRP